MFVLHLKYELFLGTVPTEYLARVKMMLTSFDVSLDILDVAAFNSNNEYFIGIVRDRDCKLDLSIPRSDMTESCCVAAPKLVKSKSPDASRIETLQHHRHFVALPCRKLSIQNTNRIFLSTDAACVPCMTRASFSPVMFLLSAPVPPKYNKICLSSL